MWAFNYFTNPRGRGKCSEHELRSPSLLAGGADHGSCLSPCTRSQDRVLLACGAPPPCPFCTCHSRLPFWLHVVSVCPHVEACQLRPLCGHMAVSPSDDS